MCLTANEAGGRDDQARRCHVGRMQGVVWTLASGPIRVGESLAEHVVIGWNLSLDTSCVHMVKIVCRVDWHDMSARHFLRMRCNLSPR